MDAFERIKKIGKGSFGDVLLVKRKSDQMCFVLKRVDLANRDQSAVDPLNEVKVLKSLDHPNIIYHYDSFIHNNKLCIVMEYADNGTLYPLFTILQPTSQTTSSNQSSPTNSSQKTQFVFPHNKQQVLNWFAQLCLALQHLHSQKILHRDIKLQNIFLTKDGLIKIGDFGISRTLEYTAELAQTSIGTPFYLSPEVCQSRCYNHKIDIWMLGCALYELCSLEKPFQGESINAIVNKIMNEHPSRIPKHYSEFIADMVDWMLDKSPDQRPEISTIMQMPQMQKELWKLKVFYGKLNVNIGIPLLKACNKPERKVNQNSIHFLVEKARQQSQQQSPLNGKSAKAKLLTQPQSQSKEETFISEPNSPHFKSHKCDDSMANCKKSYQRVMSINTQLENNERKQQYDESGPSTKPKMHQMFAEQIFNPNAPTSPNRTILLTDFLKRRLGDEKFNQMRILLESSSDPIKLLDSRECGIQEILTEQNMEYIKIFKILLTNSVTPQASHFRNKSTATFSQQPKESDSIMDLIKDVEFDPDINVYPAFEVSFKNFVNYEANYKL